MDRDPAGLRRLQLGVLGLEPAQELDRRALAVIRHVAGDAGEPVSEAGRGRQSRLRGRRREFDLVDDGRFVGIVHLRPGGDHHHDVRGMAGHHRLDHLGLVGGGGLGVADGAREPDVVVERRASLGRVQRHRIVAGRLILEDAAAEPVEVGVEVVGDGMGTARAALDDAVHARGLVELGRIRLELGEGLRRRKPGLLVEVAAVVEQRDQRRDRQRHQLAVGRHRLLLGVVVDGVAERVDLGIELEAGVDVGDRIEEAAGIHLGEPAGVHDQDVVLAALGADRVALLLQRAGEGIDVELDLVAGRRLIGLDRAAEAGEPGRLVHDDGDRRLALGVERPDAAGAERSAETGGPHPLQEIASRQAKVEAHVILPAKPFHAGLPSAQRLSDIPCSYRQKTGLAQAHWPLAWRMRT